MITFFLLMLSALHYWGWLRLPGLPVAPAEAVPPTMPVVLHFPEGGALWSSAESTDGSLAAHLRPYRSWLERLGIDPGQQPVLLALQHTGPGGLAVTVILDDPAGRRGLADRLGSLDSVAWSRSTYRGQAIFHLEAAAEPPLSLAVFRNLLILGHYPLQVEEAVGQLKGWRAGLYWTDAYRRLRRGWKKGDSCQVYLNAAQLSELPGGVAPGVPGAIHRHLSAGALRLRGSGGDLSWSGKVLPAEESNLLTALAGQAPARPDSLLGLLPAAVARLTWWSASDPEAFYQALAGGETSRFQRFLLPAWQGAAALAVFETRGDGREAEPFLLLRCRDAGAMAGQLAAYGDEVGRLEQYRYQAFEISQLLEEDLLGPLSSLGAFPMRNPFYTFLGEYVLFAPSRSALEIWIDQYTVGNTLAARPQVLRFLADNSRPAQAFFLWNTARPGTLGALLSELGLPPAQLSRLGYVGFQLHREGASWQLAGDWRVKEEERPPAAAFAWKTPLGAPARTQPFPLQLGREGLHFAVQDEADFLYLLDGSGRIRWRRRLDGPLLSEVQVVAAYRTGELLLLGNTARRIYLLGTDGEDRHPFPMALTPAAVNGVTTADFEGDGNFALFVACDNGGIYGFDRLGRPLPGWNPRPGVGTVPFPVRHFQYQNSDYLLALNEAGSQFVFRRDGSFRLPVQTWDTTFLSPPAYQINRLSSRMVATDRTGACYVTNMEGASFRLQLPVGDRTAVRFIFADVTGDERKDYIVLDGPHLSVYYYEGSAFRKKFSYSFEKPQDELFAVDLPGRDKAGIGTLRRASAQLFLLDGDGQPAPGFPLGGMTPFCIVDPGGAAEPVVVTGSPDGVVAYRPDP